MLKDRQKSILEAVIQEYFRIARPVASKDLAERGQLEVSPATIRSDMLELDDLGYLEQPHTSAGRVPTDKGYRFFVDYLIEDFSLSELEQSMLKDIFKVGEIDKMVKYMSRTLSRVSGTFAAAGLFDDSSYYDSGFAQIMSEPELRDPENVKTFGRLVDFLNDNLREISGADEFKDRFFIGCENSLKEARGYSIVLSKWSHPREDLDGFFALVAPRRTNYEKHIAIVETLKSLYE